MQLHIREWNARDFEGISRLFLQVHALHLELTICS